MPVSALHHPTKEDIGSFLRQGAVIGMGPDHILIGWGKAQRSKAPGAERVIFYTPDFYLEDADPWLTFENVALTDRGEMIKALDDAGPATASAWKWEDPKKSEFEKVFSLIQTEIGRGKIKKAVPVTFARCKVTIDAVARARLLANLLRKATKPTPYGFWLESEGMLGASPESLFVHDAQNGVLSTMALAGTRASAEEKDKPLTTDEKEVFEHQLVIKGLREKLAHRGDLNVSPTYTWNIGSISHLRTDVEVELSENSDAAKLFAEMIELLHPTAALGVAPNSADWKWLKNADGQTNRRRFGAPFGVLNREGKSLALVAIRGLQWSNYYALIGTGCGIVAASQAENEWQELELKRRYVRDLFEV